MQPRPLAGMSVVPAADDHTDDDRSYAAAMPTKTTDCPRRRGFDFVFFDCDSTLSSIEGIDELARSKGRFEEIKKMTDAAMEGEIYLDAVYDRRLEMLAPTRAEISDLDAQYRSTVVRNAREVIAALGAVGKEVFIVSGGLVGAVRPFGRWLGVPHHHVRAVDLHYDELSGEWWDFQRDSWDQRPDVIYRDSEDTPLIESAGKAPVVRDMLGDRFGRSMLIGDGVSDLAAADVVDLFVGFTGVVERPRVADEADVVISRPDLAPVLNLALSDTEQAELAGAPARRVLEAGAALIDRGDVFIRKGVKL